MTALDWSQVDHAPTLAEAMADEVELTADLCPTDEACDVATTCTICETAICDEHGDDLLTCAGDLPKFLHHWGCRKGCADCQAFFAEERAAKAGEDWS